MHSYFKHESWAANDLLNEDSCNL